MLKILQARLQQTWPKNFQVFKLDLEKKEEPEIKLPTFTGSSKKQESSRKTSISALLTMPNPLTLWITITVERSHLQEAFRILLVLFLFPPSPLFLPGFPHSSVGKESAFNAGDLGSISGLGRSPGEGKGYPLQYSGLENSMDYTAHGVAKSWTWLSDFHFCFFAASQLLGIAVVV